MIFELYSGIGNRFLLTEEAALVPHGAELARQVCAPGQLVVEGVDGLLFVSDRPGATPRMTIFNSDGSRPRACGNGLRCVGWHLTRKRALSGQAPEEIRVETDAGERSVRLWDQTGARANLSTDMGPIEASELRDPHPRVPGLLATGKAWLGNPHAVLLVRDERELDARTIHGAFARHIDFPDGVNLGLLALHDGAWHLRVHERGVGETAACGTGATAAAATLARLGRIPEVGEIRIRMAGGDLRVQLLAKDRAQLFGQAEHLGSCEALEVPLDGAPWAISPQS